MTDSKCAVKQDHINLRKIKKFISLADYEEVTDGEIQRLTDTIKQLRQNIKNNDQNKSMDDEEEDEENLCSICYARQSNAIFQPCKHRSCKTCIKQHMMSTNECFYCKATIEGLLDASMGDLG